MSTLRFMLRQKQYIEHRIKLLIYARLLNYVGNRVSIHPTVTINWPEHIYISDDCHLYRGVYLNARTSQKIGIWLGKGVKIHEYSYIDPYGGYIHLDDFVGIGQHCVIAGHGGLDVGKYTMIAGLTYVVPANHLTARKDVPYVHQGETREGIKIGNNVWIGAGCVITDGVTIGDNTVVGAGSIVTKDIPANVIAVGVPAKPVRRLNGEQDHA